MRINHREFVVITLLLLFSCSPQKTSSDREKEDLHGKVQFYVQSCFEAINNSGKIEKGSRTLELRQSNHQVTYNKQGNRLSSLVKDYTGKETENLVYRYDENQNNIEIKTCNSDSGDCYSQIFDYDSNGKEIELYERIHSTGKNFHVYTLVYDEKGNKIERIEHNGENRIHTRYTYQYDSKGNRIQEKRYGPMDDLYHIKISNYDSKGNKTSMDYCFREGVVEERYTYSYDQDNNLIQCIVQDGDGKLSSEYNYQYDSHGNLVEENRYYAHNNLKQKFTHQYQYDSKGNWTQRIDSKNDIPKFIYLREYKYYP